jgi:hypothetical protein
MMDAMYVQRKKLETVFFYFDTNNDGVRIYQLMMLIPMYIIYLHVLGVPITEFPLAFKTMFNYPSYLSKP